MKAAIPPTRSGASQDVVYPAAIPFLLLHLAAFAAIWTGISLESLVLCAALYGLRMFGVTAGYHRYFSHRAYTLNRPAQFLLAVIAQSSAQKSVLWWASKHRHHHLHSDTAMDVHSPRQTGFWYAHLGWIFAAKHDEAELNAVQDLGRFPELRCLHRFELLPAALLGLGTWMIAGWPGLIVGFVWSTALVYHATFCINSLAHVHGRKRYLTGDDSRNNWWLALATFGEGWHNNHHAYQSSVRQGFRWWEVDVSFYAIQALAWLRVARDLKHPPASVVRNEQRLGRKVIERAAGEIAASFHVERIATAVRGALAGTPVWLEMHEKLKDAPKLGVEWLSHLNVPALPTRHDIQERAAAMFVKSRSLDDIVERAHLLVLEAVSAHLRPASAA